MLQRETLLKGMQQVIGVGGIRLLYVIIGGYREVIPVVGIRLYTLL